jgi:hypothetical protein
MKTKQIVLGIAVLLTTAAHGQPNGAARLQGCWQRDEVVTTRLNGETSRRKVEAQCRDWIAAEKVTSACRDSLGLVRGTSNWSYEMPAPDKITLRMHLPSDTGGVTMMSPTSEGVQFEKERLARTKAYPDMKATDRNPNPEVRHDTYYTRVPADEERCVPRTTQIDAKDAWAYWKGPELARAFRRSLHELEFSVRFNDNDIARMANADVPPEERVRISNGLWKAVDKAATLDMENWDSQAALLEKTWADKKTCTDHNQTLYLASPVVRQWAADTVRETMALQHLAPRLTASLFIYRDEAKKLWGPSSVSSREVEARLKRGLISELLLLPRAAVVQLADHPNMAKMIDPGTDFVALRDLGQRNAEFFEKHLQYTDIMRCPGQLAAGASSPKVANREAAERAFKDGFAALKARAGTSADLRTGSRCRTVEKLIDMASLKASQGNLDRILDINGKPVADEAWQAFSAVNAFAYGCGVPQDTMRARQVLEQASVAMGKNKNKGKVEHGAWCQLASWYRHGIGGPKDQKLAEAWEKRVKDEVMATGCYVSTPIDPMDPWREIE